MSRKAALLLILSFAAVFVTAAEPTSAPKKVELHLISEKNETPKPISISTTEENKLTTEETDQKKLDYEKLLNTKETLLQEIRSLDEEASTDRVNFISHFHT